MGEVQRVEAITACPICLVPPGEKCRTFKPGARFERGQPHKARREAAVGNLEGAAE